MTSPHTIYLPGDHITGATGPDPFVRPPRPSRPLMVGGGHIKDVSSGKYWLPESVQSEGSEVGAVANRSRQAVRDEPAPRHHCRRCRHRAMKASLSAELVCFCFPHPVTRQVEMGGDSPTLQRPPTSVHRQQITSCQETPDGRSSCGLLRRSHDRRPFKSQENPPCPPHAPWLKLELHHEHVSRKKVRPH